jgi:hypothetical protein
MSDEVSVALNSNLVPAAPSDHFQQPGFGHAWAFSVAIDLPAALGSEDGRVDHEAGHNPLPQTS